MISSFFSFISCSLFSFISSAHILLQVLKALLPNIIWPIVHHLQKRFHSKNVTVNKDCERSKQISMWYEHLPVIQVDSHWAKMAARNKKCQTYWHGGGTCSVQVFKLIVWNLQKWVLSLSFSLLAVVFSSSLQCWKIFTRSLHKSKLNGWHSTLFVTNAQLESEASSSLRNTDWRAVFKCRTNA